ncbi:MFS transporter [Pedobacter sp. R-06]|uniref:MFS transporter n=1 Tax=Pedobacter sp. R-06 TaxID=3404051 RepID=UPI003CE8E31D
MIQQIKRSHKGLLSLTYEYTTLFACMLVMFQAYLIAPLSPSLARDFASPLPALGIPVFAIAFSIAATATAYLKIHVPVRGYLLLSLGSMALGCYLLSISETAFFFLITRALVGFGTGALLPMTILHNVCHTKKPKSLERIVPVVFALAMGMTFSPSIGGWLNGVFGWRMLYLCLSILCTLFLILCLLKKVEKFIPPGILIENSGDVKSFERNAGFIYSFSFLTGLFHSGVFVWISHYFTVQYRLNESEIATELFIFGFPGFALSFLFHHLQMDKKMITFLYATMGLTILGLLLLWGDLSLGLAECLLAVISIGFGCSQPLFMGLVKLPQGRQTLLSPAAHGTGFLFGGYGIGPLVMFALLSINLSTGLLFLISTVAALAYISIRIWKKNGIPANSVFINGK